MKKYIKTDNKFLLINLLFFRFKINQACLITLYIKIQGLQ